MRKPLSNQMTSDMDVARSLGGTWMCPLVNKGVLLLLLIQR